MNIPNLKNYSQSEFRVIDSEAGLKDIAKKLRKEKAVAVDLEADSMYHFKEKVCLLQLATEEKTIIIDPLEIEDLGSLKSLFINSDVKKIFHGSDYDVRSLYRDFGIEINNLFDTQLASMFLGLKETGLDAVLKNRFNVNIDKKYQKKDWSQRPLSNEMMEYAAGDAMYLVPLARILENELEEKNRLFWVREECEMLSKVRPVLSDSNPLFLKFKGAGRLEKRCLAVLEALLQFRFRIAQQKDKPLFKIIGNGPIMKIAIAKPVSLRQLERRQALSPFQIKMYGDALVGVINEAIKIPEKDLPVYPRKKGQALKRSTQKRAKALKAWRALKAKDLEIDPSLIFNNFLINCIATRNPVDIEGINAINEMKNWQKEEFGKAIVGILDDDEFDKDYP